MAVPPAFNIPLVVAPGAIPFPRGKPILTTLSKDREWRNGISRGARPGANSALVAGTVEAGDRDCTIINDLLEVDGYTVTADQAEHLAAFNRGSSFSNPGIRIAYVTRDPKLIWLMRAAAVFSSYSVQAFPTLDAAREWAGKGC
ncbi:MAG: hypothetical protein HYY97_05405 [Rhodocyclales bacterium]|nr:hypothetical protein [Rhodocyclales bacterium]